MTHGETAAICNAGRIDFSRTTIFTSLSPRDVCANFIREYRAENPALDLEDWRGVAALRK